MHIRTVQYTAQSPAPVLLPSAGLCACSGQPPAGDWYFRQLASQSEAQPAAKRLPQRRPPRNFATQALACQLFQRLWARIVESRYCGQAQDASPSSSGSPALHVTASRLYGGSEDCHHSTRTRAVTTRTGARLHGAPHISSRKLCVCGLRCAPAPYACSCGGGRECSVARVHAQVHTLLGPCR